MWCKLWEIPDDKFNSICSQDYYHSIDRKLIQNLSGIEKLTTWHKSWNWHCNDVHKETLWLWFSRSKYKSFQQRIIWSVRTKNNKEIKHSKSITKTNWSIELFAMGNMPEFGFIDQAKILKQDRMRYTNDKWIL